MKLFIILLCTAVAFTAGQEEAATDEAATDAAATDEAAADETSSNTDGGSEAVPLNDAAKQLVTSATVTMGNTASKVVETLGEATNEGLGIGKELVGLGTDSVSALAVAGVGMAKSGGGAVLGVSQSVVNGVGGIGNKAMTGIGKLVKLVPIVGGTAQGAFNKGASLITDTTTKVASTIDSGKTRGAAVMDKASELITKGQTQVNAANEKVSSTVASGVTKGSSLIGSGIKAGFGLGRKTINSVLGIFG